MGTEIGLVLGGGVGGDGCVEGAAYAATTQEIETDAGDGGDTAEEGGGRYIRIHRLKGTNRYSTVQTVTSLRWNESPSEHAKIYSKGF